MAAKVLVIEDSRVMGEVMVFNLRHHGYQAQLAVNGSQALEMMQAQDFQVVLLDYQIPRMNGEEICQAMRQLPGYAQTPVIICSAKGYELDATRLREELGIANVLPKPFSPLELMALVNELTASATPASY
jgi:CheY-like chemotaxis protein